MFFSILVEKEQKKAELATMFASRATNVLLLMNDYVSFRSPRAQQLLEKRFFELEAAVLTAQVELEIGVIKNA